LPFRLREKMGTRKNKNVKVIFLLGSALNRAGRRGFAFDSQAKIFPLKLPQFLPARQRDVEEEKTPRSLGDPGVVAHVLRCVCTSRMRFGTFVAMARL